MAKKKEDEPKTYKFLTIEDLHSVSLDVAFAYAALLETLPVDPEPFVNKTDAGGLLITWHTPREREIEILPDGSIEHDDE